MRGVCGGGCGAGSGAGGRVVSMKGRPPKENPQDGGKRRTLEWTDLGTEPIPGAPALGRKPGGGQWLKATQEWWRVWCRAPQASQFLDTDWNHLRRTAVLLDAYLRHPTVSAFRAIEHAEGLLGGTIASRLQLRLRVRPPGAAAASDEEAKPEPAAKRRRVAKGDPRRLQLVKDKSA